MFERSLNFPDSLSLVKIHNEKFRQLLRDSACITQYFYLRNNLKTNIFEEQNLAQRTKNIKPSRAPGLTNVTFNDSIRSTKECHVISSF